METGDRPLALLVYAGWLGGGGEPPLIGTLFLDPCARGAASSFEYSPQWIESGRAATFLDPDLRAVEGRQFPKGGRRMLGMAEDALPDRWGRTLFQRRENIQAAQEDRKPRKLREVDFLAGQEDALRSGGLRFKLEEEGPFVESSRLPIPPLASLRELEHSSLSLEDRDDPERERWLAQLLMPGSSLGGARPKANVAAPDGTLLIAKFPSRGDDWDVGAWECVANRLMRRCGLSCARGREMRLSASGTTYLSERFDRAGGARLHFMSAMAALGEVDGGRGAGYQDMALFLLEHGSDPEGDVRELWCRIAFNIAVSNTDDHLRNHGFLLRDEGWSLAPAYDVNPVMYGMDLTTAYGRRGEAAMDLSCLIDLAPDYGLGKDEAWGLARAICDTVGRGWRREAEGLGVPRAEIAEMAPAFDVAYKNLPKTVVGMPRPRRGREIGLAGR